MSEKVEYYIQIKKITENDYNHFLSFHEKTIVSNAETYSKPLYDKKTKTLEFDFTGYRGGGYTCEETLKDMFKLFFKNHPHLRANFECHYIEQPPCEVITYENGKYTNHGIDEY